MRKIFKETPYLIYVVFLLFMLDSFCFAKDLIDPTRTLKSGREAWGKLTVFSEPPELDVFLDGRWAGQTPLWLTMVKPGPHRLNVGNSKTKINVETGKETKIGLFNEAFVILPATVLKAPAGAERAVRPSQEEEAAEIPPQQRKRDLSHWDLYVNGTLRFF